MFLAANFASCLCLKGSILCIMFCLLRPPSWTATGISTSTIHIVTHTYSEFCSFIRTLLILQGFQFLLLGLNCFFCCFKFLRFFFLLRLQLTCLGLKFLELGCSFLQLLLDPLLILLVILFSLLQFLCGRFDCLSRVNNTLLGGFDFFISRFSGLRRTRKDLFLFG